jgi:hypothetical protein
MTQSETSKLFYLVLAVHIVLTGWLFSGYADSAVPNKYLNKNIFVICVVFAAYTIAKGTIIHKVVFCGNVLLDFFVERILIPIAMAMLIYRYVNSGFQVVDDFRFRIVTILFADPFSVVHEYLRNTETIQSGKFLGPLIPAQPKSAFDYIGPALFFTVIYFAMLR